MRVTGDSVGPRVGDILKARGVNCFVYGDSISNVNAHKLEMYQNLLSVCHAGDVVIAGGAARGEDGDVGRVNITKNGLFPGRALGRESKAVGDIGVLAVVGEKSGDNFARLAAGSEEFAEFMAKKTADITQELVEYIDRLADEKSSPRGVARPYPALTRKAEREKARARV